MGRLLFRRGKRYDRSRSLARAAQARGRGRGRKAIQHYREVLEHEPGNADVHRRVAPLLARAGDSEQAWQSYRVAVRDLERNGFLDRALGVLREATAGLSPLRELWEEISRLEIQRDRPVDAHRALLEGRRALGSRARRADAIQLLMAARKLRPHDFEPNYDLACLLARSGARGPADQVLRGLAARAEGRQLRRTRARQFRLTPSPERLRDWLRSWIGRR